MMTTLRFVALCGLCLLGLPAPVLAQPMSLAQADEIFFPLIFKAYVKFKKPTIFERLRTKEPTIKTYIDPLIRDSSASILLSDKREELIQKNKLPKQSQYKYSRCCTIENYISFLPNKPENFERINFYNTHCKPLMPFRVITIDELKYNVKIKAGKQLFTFHFQWAQIGTKLVLKKHGGGNGGLKLNGILASKCNLKVIDLFYSNHTKY